MAGTLRQGGSHYTTCNIWQDGRHFVTGTMWQALCDKVEVDLWQGDKHYVTGLSCAKLCVSYCHVNFLVWFRFASGWCRPGMVLKNTFEGFRLLNVSLCLLAWWLGVWEGQLPLSMGLFFKNKFWTPPCVSVYMTEMLTKYLNWRRVARWLLCKISYFQTCFLIAKRILFEASDPCVKKSFQNSWR